VKFSTFFKFKVEEVVVLQFEVDVEVQFSSWSSTFVLNFVPVSVAFPSSVRERESPTAQHTTHSW
jgi:hypothetical protein